MNEAQITIRMSRELKERLEELAEADGRSLNNLVNKLAWDYVRKNRSVHVYKGEGEGR